MSHFYALPLLSLHEYPIPLTKSNKQQLHVVLQSYSYLVWGSSSYILLTSTFISLNILFSNGKGLEPLRLEEELDIHHLETLMFKFMTHIPDRVALKAWLARRGSMYRDQSRFHSAGLMTLEEFHEMLADLLGVETWDDQKVAVFDREIETLFKKVKFNVIIFNVVSFFNLFF